MGEGGGDGEEEEVAEEGGEALALDAAAVGNEGGAGDDDDAEEDDDDDDDLLGDFAAELEGELEEGQEEDDEDEGEILGGESLEGVGFEEDGGMDGMDGQLMVPSPHPTLLTLPLPSLALPPRGAIRSSSRVLSIVSWRPPARGVRVCAQWLTPCGSPRARARVPYLYSCGGG